MSDVRRRSPRAGGPPRTSRLATWALAALAALAPSGARALPAEPPPPSPAELKQLPIELLLDVEVTSAAKRPQALASTPASLTLLSAEDLLRSGVRNLPEALRLAAGLHVARFDSRTWAISARGFNATTANKMLVLIDGRSVYTPLFSGVFWDVQNPLLEDVERIEVVRGPGSTLWGANAVNGVINVITRSAADTQGSLAVLGTGNEQQAFAALRHGGTLGQGHYRVYGEYDLRDALALSDGRSARDPLRIVQGGFRADLPAAAGDLTVQGDLYGGVIGHLVRDDTDVSGGNLLGHWTRHLGAASDLSFRGYYDHTFRRVPGQFQEERHTWDLDAQHRWQRGRHDLLWGGGYRFSRDRVGDTAQIGWDPNRESNWVANLFVQDQLRLAERWRLQVGARLEDQSTMDPEVLPAVAIAWQLAPDRLLWTGAGRAVRAPARIDRDIRAPGEGPPFLLGNKDFVAEELLSYELGYRMAAGGQAVFDVVAFYSDYDSLRTQEPTPPLGVPIVLDNRARGTIRGLGLNGGWQALQRLRLQGAVTFLRDSFRLEPGSRDPTGGSSEANDPGHHWSLRADLELPRDVELEARVRNAGALPNPRVPAYTEVDLRLGWRRPGGWELSLVGQNLLHDAHPEFGAPLTREEVERGVYAQVTWRR